MSSFVLQVPDLPKKHWSGTSAWQMVEACNEVLVQDLADKLRASRFIALSLDEATAVDNTSYLCVHAYVLVGWERVPLFIKVRSYEAGVVTFRSRK